MISDIAHLWLLSILGKSGVWIRNFSIRASVLDYLRFGNTENNSPVDGQSWYKTEQNQLNASGPFVLIQKAFAATQNPSTTVAATFSKTPIVGNEILALVIIGGNSGDGNPTFSISDNSTGGPNTYTSQKYQSGSANGLSAQIWSAPIVHTVASFNVTVTEAGASVTWGQGLEIYECQGLASGTAISATGYSSGSFPTINETIASIIISGITINVSGGSPTVAFTNSIDSGGFMAIGGAGIARGNGTWSNSNAGSISYCMGASAGFS